MSDEKKLRQLEAIENFGRALHELHCEGIYFQDDITEKITLVDQETGEQVGQIAYSGLLARLTGQDIDELAVSDDYFRDAIKSFRDRMNEYPDSVLFENR